MFRRQQLNEYSSDLFSFLVLNFVLNKHLKRSINPFRKLIDLAMMELSADDVRNEAVFQRISDQVFR